MTTIATEGALPRSATHPLHLLDAFLGTAKPAKSVEGQDGGNDDGDDHNVNRLRRRREDDATDARRDAVLRAADFLYGSDSAGGPGGSSLLESALAVLDDSRGAEGGVSTAAAVRKIRAEPSGRTALLVRGSGGRGSGIAGGGGVDSYTCLISRRDPHIHGQCCRRKRRRMGGADTNGARASVGILRQHCSCRSYYERTKAGDHHAVCKHLLAARLGPYLDGGDGRYYREETVQDEDFADVVVGRGAT